jgi:ABC-type lipoprotein release transport system permease subunit
LLQQRGLAQGCDVQRAGSFCLRLPERNNFQAALNEQSKVSRGGEFFVVLLIVLVAIGTAGHQIQTMLTRWHDCGVLQAVGFSPSQILLYYGLVFLLVFAGGIALAAIATFMLPSVVAGSFASFVWAAGASLVAAGLAALPVLLWPLSRSPAALLRESA